MDQFFLRDLQAHTTNFALILFRIQFLCMENTGENVYCVWKFKDYCLKCRPMYFTSILSQDACWKGMGWKHKPRKMESTRCLKPADTTPLASSQIFCLFRLLSFSVRQEKIDNAEGKTAGDSLHQYSLNYCPELEQKKQILRGKKKKQK